MKKILIIEDNAEIRENTAELLELRHYGVLTAENGRIGFELAKKHLPDLILCDMMMPETDGWGFLQLAKGDGAINAIPIIFFSAGSPFPEVRKALIKEAKGYLHKPFTEQELLSTIKMGLRKSR
jgi:CheY-like chemotaxis protein